MKYGFDYLTSGNYAGDWQQITFLVNTVATITTTKGDTLTDVSFTEGHTIVGAYSQINVTSGGLLAYKRRNVTKRSLFTGLLDTYSGAAAAYSLRKLDSDYSGSAIRVRRSSDNTEQDIGFTASGDLDQSALTTFTGANDGFVVTWYDQSGNSRNATQSTAARQPRIVNSGTVETTNSNPTIQWDDTDDFLRTAAFTVAQPTTWFSVSALSVVATQNVLSGGITASDRQISYAVVSSGGNKDYIFAGANLFGNTATTGQKLLVSLFNGASSTLHNNGTLSASGNAGTNSVGGITIGARYLDDEIWSGTMQEIILFPSDQSANRTSIESNINSYYSIY